MNAEKESHGEAFLSRISELFGSIPEFAYFEAPVVIDHFLPDFDPGSRRSPRPRPRYP